MDPTSFSTLEGSHFLAASSWLARGFAAKSWTVRVDVIVGNGEKKLRDAVWGASHEPPRLLSSGRLDPQLDNRFKGVFLAKDASPEMRQLWTGVTKKQRDKVSRRFIEKHIAVHYLTLTGTNRVRPLCQRCSTTPKLW